MPLNNLINNKEPFKLKYRLISSLFIFIGITTAAIYLFFTFKFEEQAVKRIQDRTEFISKYIVDKQNNSLIPDSNYFDDPMVRLFNEYDVEYLVFLNTKGLVDKAFNLEKAEKSLYLTVKEEMHLSADKKILRTTSRVNLDGSGISTIFTGFSSAEYLKNISEIKTEIAIICAGFFLTGTLLVYFISTLVTYPVSKIAGGAQMYLDGNLNHRINYSANNQAGIIAKALNSLSSKLYKANNEVENLNRQLKILFRDKIGELNLEINQRRLAEHSLKQSEKQFRLLFEMAPIGMLISAPDRSILKVNNALCKILGYNPDEMLTKKTHELTFPEDKIKSEKLHIDLLENKHSHIYFETRFIRKDNEIRYAIVESVLIRDDEGNPVHFIIQVIDITERKKAEKELVLAKEKAEESDRLKSAFLAQMSHEIRTPLNVILAAAPILADELSEGNEENEALLRSISSAGKRLQRTIDLILNMSSVQSGNYTPEPEEIDLNKELKKLTTEFDSLIAAKNLKLNFTTSVPEPVITADKYTVNQIFQNLIGNAIKYTPKGEINISVYDKDEKNIYVEVRDNGIGMSEDYMKSLFKPFSQEDAGHKREFEGNGLGLALVKKYVELNDAEIFVESSKEKGSAFTVFFKKNPSLLSSENEFSHIAAYL